MLTFSALGLAGLARVLELVVSVLAVSGRGRLGLFWLPTQLLWVLRAVAVDN